MSDFQAEGDGICCNRGSIFATRSPLGDAMREIKATYRRAARAQEPILPHYDIDLRELSVTGEVILRLPVQARSLAAVLTALEVAGWKPRVPRPLAGRPGGNDSHHLAIAAYKLNYRQRFIEFHADDGALRWNWRARLASRRFRLAAARETEQAG